MFFFDLLTWNLGSFYKLPARFAASQTRDASTTPVGTTPPSRRIGMIECDGDSWPRVPSDGLWAITWHFHTTKTMRLVRAAIFGGLELDVPPAASQPLVHARPSVVPDDCIWAAKHQVLHEAHIGLWMGASFCFCLSSAWPGKEDRLLTFVGSLDPARRRPGPCANSSDRLDEYLRISGSTPSLRSMARENRRGMMVDLLGCRRVARWADARPRSLGLWEGLLSVMGMCLVIYDACSVMLIGLRPLLTYVCLACWWPTHCRGCKTLV